MNASIILTQIMSVCAPTMVMLFGSQAKGTATPSSDIDLCIVTETSNKRRLLTELYCAVDVERPVDLIVYTPSEWSYHSVRRGSFAHKIRSEGAVLYGR